MTSSSKILSLYFVCNSEKTKVRFDKERVSKVHVYVYALSILLPLLLFLLMLLCVVTVGKMWVDDRAPCRAQSFLADTHMCAVVPRQEAEAEGGGATFTADGACPVLQDGRTHPGLNCCCHPDKQPLQDFSGFILSIVTTALLFLIASQPECRRSILTFFNELL